MWNNRTRFIPHPQGAHERDSVEGEALWATFDVSEGLFGDVYLRDVVFGEEGGYFKTPNVCIDGLVRQINLQI